MQRGYVATLVRCRRAAGVRHVPRVGCGSRRAPARADTSSGLVMSGTAESTTAATLRRTAERLHRTQDADVALAMFETKGADGLRSLVGDWSL